MVRRSRLEIYFDLLKVIERGVDKPTRIMYKTNLSWKTLQEVLSVLISKNFVREERMGNSKRYRITGKGQNALSYHRRSLEGLIANELWARV
jgi:predicted transcriptional regulator